MGLASFFGLDEEIPNAQAEGLMAMLGATPGSPQAEQLKKLFPSETKLQRLNRAFQAMSAPSENNYGGLGNFGAVLSGSDRSGQQPDMNGIAGLVNAFRPARKGSQPALLDLIDRRKQTTDPEEIALLDAQIKKLNTPDAGAQGAESVQLMRILQDPTTSPEMKAEAQKRFQFINSHAPSARTNVNVDFGNSSDKAASDALGKGVGEMAAENIKNGQAALQAAEGYQQIYNLADSALTGGFVADGVSGLVTTMAGPVKQIFGVDLVPENIQTRVAARQTMNALSNKAVLDSLGGSLGAQISDGDRSFVKDTVPNAELTPNGIKAVALAALARARWQNEYALEQGRFISQNNGLFSGDKASGTDYLSHMKKWASQNRMFDDETQDAIRGLVADSKSEFGQVKFPKAGGDPTREPAFIDKLMNKFYEE